MSQTILNPKENSHKEPKTENYKKSFFVVIDGSEDVLYLKCTNLHEAQQEVKRFLHTDTLDDSIEIIY